jgi:DNA polymerase III epsilon subunit-like protein
MNFKDRPLAIVDIETTGDDELVHEILEIGLLVVKQDSLEVIDFSNWKVRPHNIENAILAALERNGYKEEDWQNALDLADVMPIFSEKTKDAVFTSFNVSFDWAFIKQAFRTTGVSNIMDYHRIDILSIAWSKGGDKLEKFSLKTLSEYFGIPPEPEVHRAINGAKTALELLRKLRNT